MAAVEINNEEPVAVDEYLSPIRVYRTAGGSLATEPDSTGKSSLAYSVGKVVTDEKDIAAINALAGIEPEVEVVPEPEVEKPANKIVEFLTKKPAKKKRTRK